MDKFDELLKEQIKTEYDNIALEAKSLQRIKGNVRDGCNSERRWNGWNRYAKVAAIIIVAVLIAINSSAIKAFVINVYERYFMQVEREYKNNTEEYTQDLNLAIDIGESNVEVKQYVITDKGVDFKIYAKEENEIELVGCEISISGEKRLVQDMYVKSNGYYIASNVFEKGTWKNFEKGHIRGVLSLTYKKKEHENDLYTIEKPIELDLSKQYQCKEIQGKELEGIKDEQFQLKKISFYTWYMKVSYEVFEKLENVENRFMIIKQGDKELLPLGGRVGEKIAENYYQLPEDKKKMLDITLGEIDYKDKSGKLKPISSTYYLDLQKYEKEDNTNEN